MWLDSAVSPRRTRIARSPDCGRCAALIDPTIAVHKGRVVKRTGDGLLAEFRGVVEAKLTKALSLVPDHAQAWRVAGVPES